MLAAGIHSKVNGERIEQLQQQRQSRELAKGKLCSVESNSQLSVCRNQVAKSECRKRENASERAQRNIIAVKGEEKTLSKQGEKAAAAAAAAAATATVMDDGMDIHVCMYSA